MNFYKIKAGIFFCWKPQGSLGFFFDDRGFETLVSTQFLYFPTLFQEYPDRHNTIRVRILLEHRVIFISISDDENQDTKKRNSVAGSSWIHKKLSSNKPRLDQTSSYDPQHRNPTYAGANKTNHWELSLMTQHFHPSVELFAQTILDGQDIKYTGDPLQVRHYK